MSLTQPPKSTPEPQQKSSSNQNTTSQSAANSGSKLPALAVSIALTAAIALAGAWWLKGTVFRNIKGGFFRVGPLDSQPSEVNMTAGHDGSSGVSMLPGSVSSTKQKGLDAMAARDWATAKVEFAASLAEKRNDPETLIYFNNAKIGNNPAYTIALSVPASKFSNPALEIMRGVAQAQNTLNQSVGINGTPLKVLLFDDQGEPEQAQEIANALAANPNVLGVVGHYSSDTTLAAADAYEAAGLPVISPTSTAVNIASAGDYVFRTVPSDRLAASTLARHTLNTLKKKKAAVFYNSESTYSRSVKSEFATEFLSSGGDVVAEFDTAEAGFSVGNALKVSKDQEADVIMLGLTLGTVDIPIQIMAVNKRQLPIVASDSLYSPRVLDIGQENALGMTVAVPWHTLSHAQSAFVGTAQTLWGGDVNWRTAMAYDAAMTLATGIGTEPTRIGVAEALANPGFTAAGATDDVRFFPSGDRNQPSQLVKVVKGNRTSSGYEFAPVE